MKTPNKAKLRNGEIQKILENPPHAIVRYGISIICGIIVMLFVGIYYIPYPKTIEVNVILRQGKQAKKKSFYAEAFIPYNYISKIQKRQSAIISINGYKENSCGVIIGKVIYTSQNVITLYGKAYFRTYIWFNKGMNTTQNKIIRFYPHMQGKAQITYSNNTLFDEIITGIKK